MTKPITFAFFGGEPLAVPVLEKLHAAGISPALIVCNPDRPSGRGQALTMPPAKIWAKKHGIAVYQPATFKDGTAEAKLSATAWDLFVVVAYNFILPPWLLALPTHGVLNLHPSLLPKLRGASPIRSALLTDQKEAVGVTVILLDEAMDHGPILAQEKVSPEIVDWPVDGPFLDSILAAHGGELLTKTIPAWVTGKITPREQNHEEATYCQKLPRSAAELVIDPHALPTGEAGKQAWHTITAFAGIGDTYFIYQDKRVKIKKAEYVDRALRLLRVTPEGKKEVDFETYLRTLH